MTAEVGILSLPELQNFVQYQQQQSQTLNWNLKQVSQKDGDISWEVKAFEQEDSNNVTWPPRSYTCTYCSREFRSAQALGGHMNVHRRDRARLHQAPPPPPPPLAANNPFSSSPLLIQAQQVVTNDGLCIFYSLPKHNGDLNFMAPKASTNLMISKLISANPFPAYNTLPSESNNHGNNLSNMHRNMVIEEIDLELRLGRR